ncbi:MAG: hypothetical protein HC875_19900 [Anaerolineales bacterium]|nr:hypothetical protein [Anaerolineales bacterium]
MSSEITQHISTFIQAKYAAGLQKSTLKFYEHVLTEFSHFAEWPPPPTTCGLFWLISGIIARM